MKVAIRIVFALLLMLGAAGASPREQVTFGSKATFLPHPDCPKLRLDLSIRRPERACEEIRQVAADVAAALALEFDLPRIFLVGDQQRFGELIGKPGSRATGAVFLGEIYLGPRAFETARWHAIRDTHDFMAVFLQRLQPSSDSA